jgi:hypothetical protein
MRARQKCCNARARGEPRGAAMKEGEPQPPSRPAERIHASFGTRNLREIRAHEKIMLTFAFEILSP